MKKWNAPEIAELNVTETENGFFNSDVESFIFFNDSKKPVKPSESTDNSINNSNDTNSLS